MAKSKKRSVSLNQSSEQDTSVECINVGDLSLPEIVKKIDDLEKAGYSCVYCNGKIYRIRK